ncbi:MAG: diguanylate cyclase [Bacillota bacterium]|nr:diguanylate cyclase [Bacillota bacterium]
MYYNPYALPLFISSLLMIHVAYQAWILKTSGRGSFAFSLLALACALYSLAYALEISSATLDFILIFLRFEYIGISVLPAFFILFALEYTGRKSRLSAFGIAALFIIPVVTVILFYTNHYHGLMYQSYELNVEGPFPVIAFERGLWYWVQSMYAIFAILFSNILFAIMWVSSNAVYRKQIAVMLIGSLIPWLGFLFYLARPFPWCIDLNPYFISISALFYFWGLIRYRLFDLLPVARTKLFEELPDGALILDDSMRIIDLNTTARNYLQISQLAIGKPAAEVLDYWPKLVKLLNKKNRKYHVELKHPGLDDPTWFRVDFLPLHEEDSLPYGQMIIIRDITDRKLVEEKLHKLATTDELTGLWNRRYFMQAINKELYRSKRYNQHFSLIMFDLDHFKEINDNFGHTAGDKSLEHLASIFKMRLRNVDLFARLGGEEFGIILPGTSLESAFLLAEDLRCLISASPVFYEEREIRFTISLGVTASHEEIENVEEILKAADKALYQAKEKGRNCTVINISV